MIYQPFLLQEQNIVYDMKIKKFFLKILFTLKYRTGKFGIHKTKRKQFSFDMVSLDQIKELLTLYINYSGPNKIFSIKSQSLYGYEGVAIYNTIKLINHNLFLFKYNVENELVHLNGKLHYPQRQTNDVESIYCVEYIVNEKYIIDVLPSLNFSNLHI